MAENLGASFSIDVAALKAGLAQANKLIRESESEFKAAAAGMGDWTKSQEGLEKKIKSLNDIASVQEKKVAALKTEYNRLIAEGLDPTSNKAIDLRTQINKETEALNKSKSEIEKNQKALDNFGKETEDADKGLKDMTKSSEDATKGFTVMRGALADLVSKGIQAAITGFKDLAKNAVSAYKEVDEGADNVIKATGATGETAKELEESYRNVAKSIKGDFGDIGSALGEVNTRFGKTGKDLEETTKDFLQFSEITGMDATTAVKDVSRALESAGIDSKDYRKVLDQLASAAQASGVSIDKMTEGLTKYGAPMRALGFDTSDTIAIFAQFEKAGVNTEQAFAGMQKAVQNWTKDGKNAKTEFGKVMEQIKNAPNDTSAAQIAMENFGNKAGTEMADAIKTGRLEYGDFLKIIEGSEGTVNKTYEQTQDGFDKLGVVIQGVKTEMAEFVGEIMDKYGPQIEKFIQNVSKTAKKIISWTIKNLPKIEAALAGIVAGIAAFKAVTIITKAITIFKSLYTTLKLVKTGQLALNAAMLANPVGIIVGAIAGLVAAFVVLWNKSEAFRNFFIGMWEAIKETVGNIIDGVVNFFKSAAETVSGVWQSIKETVMNVIDAIVGFFKSAWEAIKAAWSAVVEFFSGIWEGIKNTFAAVGEWFSNIFKNAWNGIKNAFSSAVSFFFNIWTGIKNTFASVGSWFKGVFSRAWTGIKSVFSKVGEFFGGIWDTIKEKFTTIGTKVAEAIGGAFKAAINAVIATIEGALNLIPNAVNGVLDLINLLPGVEIPHIPTFNLPRLAKGGVVTKATNAIVGEAGDEAVLPLERNTGWMDTLAEKIAAKGGSGVVVNQTNNYAAAHSRYEIFKSQQATARAVKLAMGK